MAPFFLFTLLPLYSEVALLHGVEALRVVRTRPVTPSTAHGMDAMVSVVSIPSIDETMLGSDMKNTKSILGRFQKLVHLEDCQGLTKKEIFTKVGISAILGYSLIMNVGYVTTLSLSWYIHSTQVRLRNAVAILLDVSHYFWFNQQPLDWFESIGARSMETVSGCEYGVCRLSQYPSPSVFGAFCDIDCALLRSVFEAPQAIWTSKLLDDGYRLVVHRSWHGCPFSWRYFSCINVGPSAHFRLREK